MTSAIDKLMSLKTYVACRQQFQPGLGAHRRRRTVVLGEHMNVQFEDEVTLRYQVKEMQRAECVDDNSAIQYEIDTYVHLMPDGSNWNATLLLQYPDDEKRKHALPLLADVAEYRYVKADGSMSVTMHGHQWYAFCAFSLRLLAILSTKNGRGD